MRKLLLACTLFVSSLATLQAQTFADFVVDAGPCDPIIPLICPGGVQNPNDAVNGDPSSFALLRTDLGLLSEAFLELGFSTPVPAGSLVGFVIAENNTILNVDLIESLTVEVLDENGNIVAQDGDFGLTDLNVIFDNDENRLISVATPDTGNYQIASIRITLNGLLSVANDLAVFSGVALQNNSCNFMQLTTIIETDNVDDEANLIDEDPNTFATISLPLSLTMNGFIEMGLETPASGGDFVGYTIEPNNTFLQVGAIQNIEISGFDTAGNELFVKDDFAIADLNLIANTSARSQIGFSIPSEETYQVASIRITVNPNIGVLSDLRVYNGFVAPNFVNGIEITASAPQLCTGASITLTAEDGFDSYSWNNGETTQSIVVSNPGTYRVIASNNNDNCQSVGTIDISNQDVLIAFEAVNPTCNTADGSLTAIVNGGSGSYSYLWSNGSTDSNIVGLQAAVYSVTITDDSLGCVVTRSFNLDNAEGTFFTAFVSNETDGQGNGAIFLSLNESDSVTVSWVDGSTAFIRQGLSAGTYTAQVRNNQNCLSIKSFTVVNTANNNGDAGGGNNFNFTISAEVTQPGCGANNGAINLSVSDANRIYTYNWSNGSQSQDISNLEGGLYTITVTDVVTGIQVDSTFALNEQAAPTLILTNITEETCSGDRNASITINSGLPTNQVLWSNGVTANNNPNLAPGAYQVSVTSPLTMCTAVAEYIITRRMPISLNLGSTDITCDPDTMNGTAFVNATGGRTPYSFLWSTGSVNDTISNLASGTYTLMLMDANGCTVTDSVSVANGPDCDDDNNGGGGNNGDAPEVENREDIVNVFTPNNDGTNDSWRIVQDPDSYEELDLKVYNRYGDEAYFDSRYSNNWFGTYKNTNEALPDGTYFYELRATRGGVTNNIKGFIVIKR